MTDSSPRLAREKSPPKAAIVHLGLGAFFRAHGALITEDAMRDCGRDWGIIGVSLRSPGIRDKLAEQDNVYTAVEMSGTGRVPRVVEALSGVVFAPEDPDALLLQMADPAIKIVSLTVTEKGYCHIPATGELDVSQADIQADIKSKHPSTAVGYLVRALEMRRNAGLRPFTVLSCDNLPNNGCVAQNVVVGLAACIDADLARWIASECRFPSTMVDRIVPATTAEDIDLLAGTCGHRDLAPVFHEPFCQWVVEDRFVDGARPDYGSVAGVQMVENVEPFELMKLRMLNGTHSALAYLGYLAGCETISDTVQEAVFRGYLQRVWRDEIIPTITPPLGVDLTAYADELLRRYANPAIKHRTWQIAMDGSQKLPQRILGTIAECQGAGRRCDGLILAVAGWMRYVGGVDEKGKTIDVQDPLAERLRAVTEAGSGPYDVVDKLLSVREIFSAALAEDLKEDLAQAYEALAANGVRQSMMSYIDRAR